VWNTHLHRHCWLADIRGAALRNAELFTREAAGSGIALLLFDATRPRPDGFALVGNPPSSSLNWWVLPFHITLINDGDRSDRRQPPQARRSLGPM
jgi:hypothetical protein